jgi:hypothetical protein
MSQKFSSGDKIVVSNESGESVTGFIHSCKGGRVNISWENKDSHAFSYKLNTLLKCVARKLISIKAET